MDVTSLIEAYGFGTTNEVLPIRGEYDKQEVIVNPNSKSCIQLAEELDDGAIQRIQESKKWATRDIKSKKKVVEKNKILSYFANRLDEHDKQRPWQYREFESTTDRMLEKAMVQDTSGDDEDSTEVRLKHEDTLISELILEQAAEKFDEVTDQDNAIEYLESVVDFEIENAGAEIEQAQKSIMRLEGRTDEKSLNRKKDLENKVNSLKTKSKKLKLFKRELAFAKKALRNAHGQEIKIGYNVIKKATDLYALYADKFEGTHAMIVSDAYRQMLSASTLVEGMDITFRFFGAKNIKSGMRALLELSGADIKSVNPSCSVPHLISIRNVLFKTEISSQLFDSVGGLRVSFVKTFPECGGGTFGELEQFTTTKEIAKFTQQSYVSPAQLQSVLSLFGVKGEGI